MEVIYADKNLALIETDMAKATKLPISVIISARDKIQFLRGADDERDIRNWKSLHYEKLSGDMAGQHSIRVNKKWRIVFEIDKSRSPSRITILTIEDYH